ncbi:hypothetical protein ABW20_dc0105432 [Dactylellina cionopaga]|nr:hypothetical protein ABW20_dc0105432 [Dactylellina cionopaga]
MRPAPSVTKKTKDTLVLNSTSTSHLVTADEKPVMIQIACTRPDGLGAHLKTPTILSIQKALNLTDNEYQGVRDTITTALQDNELLRNLDLDVCRSTKEQRDEFCKVISEALTSSLSENNELITKLAVTNKDKSPWLLYKLVLLRRKRMKSSTRGEDDDTTKNTDEMSIFDISTSSANEITTPSSSMSDGNTKTSKKTTEMFTKAPPRSPSPGSPSKRTFRDFRELEEEKSETCGKIFRSQNKEKKGFKTGNAQDGSPAQPPTKKIRSDTESSSSDSDMGPTTEKDIFTMQARSVASQGHQTDTLDEPHSFIGPISPMCFSSSETRNHNDMKEKCVEWIPATCAALIAFGLSIWYVRTR